eukprot:5960593-Pyramimonas_sp.AAC.1
MARFLSGSPCWVSPDPARREASRGPGLGHGRKEREATMCRQGKAPNPNCTGFADPNGPPGA